MDTDEGLRRWRVAQRELAAEEVAMRQEAWNTSSSRRVIGLIQQSNAVHRGQRPEEENVQLVSRFYHVKPPRAVLVGDYITPSFKANALPPMTHASQFSSDDIYEGIGNPSIPAEIELHNGIASKYKARRMPDVPPYTGSTFEAKPDEAALKSKAEKELEDAEKKAEEGPAAAQAGTQGQYGFSAELAAATPRATPRGSPATPATPAPATAVGSQQTVVGLPASATAPGGALSTITEEEGATLSGNQTGFDADAVRTGDAERAGLTTSTLPGAQAQQAVSPAVEAARQAFQVAQEAEREYNQLVEEQKAAVARYPNTRSKSAWEKQQADKEAEDLRLAVEEARQDSARKKSRAARLAAEAEAEVQQTNGTNAAAAAAGEPEDVEMPGLQLYGSPAPATPAPRARPAAGPEPPQAPPPSAVKSPLALGVKSPVPPPPPRAAPPLRVGAPLPGVTAGVRTAKDLQAEGETQGLANEGLFQYIAKGLLRGLVAALKSGPAEPAVADFDTELAKIKLAAASHKLKATVPAGAIASIANDNELSSNSVALVQQRAKNINAPVPAADVPAEPSTELLSPRKAKAPEGAPATTATATTAAAGAQAVGALTYDTLRDDLKAINASYFNKDNQAAARVVLAPFLKRMGVPDGDIQADLTYIVDEAYANGQTNEDKKAVAIGMILSSSPKYGVTGGPKRGPPGDPRRKKEGPKTKIMGGFGKPAKRARFEKGSEEAKAYMAELRAKRRK